MMTKSIKLIKYFTYFNNRNQNKVVVVNIDANQRID